jgi:flagellar hook-associated protein 2
MAIDSDYVQSMSQQLAQYAVQSQLTRAQRNESNYSNQLTAVSKLDTALKKFKSTASGLTTSTTGMLVNSATLSQSTNMTATASAKAVSGSYEFFVSQLASKSQFAISGLQDDSIGAGSLTLAQGSKSFSVSLDGLSSISDVATAINSASDNSGIKATLVRSNGQVNLVLSSEETGLAQAISMTSSGNAALADALGNAQELSPAQDAKIYLGGVGGIELTNSSNTFDNVIDGVSLTLTKAQDAKDTPVTLTIGQDKSASQTKVQKFIDGFNTLLSTFNELTTSGTDSTSRGVLAGDSSVRAIKSMLNSLVRTSFGGANLIDFGISADSKGQLTIDSTRFEKALAANPDGFDKLFGGKGNLLDTLDKSLATYTASTGGILTNRKATLNQQISKISVQYDNIQTQYDSFYSRYLKQYSNLMTTMNAMEQTTGMFT